MPGTPRPVGEGPSRIPVFWNGVLQRLGDLGQHQRAVETSRTQGSVIDAAGNTQRLWGTNLSQVVIIGAVSGPSSSGGTAGVQVATGLSGSGEAKQTSLATGTITTTAGSTTATLVSTTSGTFANGLQIGAANVSDPTSGVATPAITPGTTMTITGSTITLSKAAAESGTGIYAAACSWTLV